MLLRNIPKRPTGSDAFHVWAQWVHDRLLKLTFGDSPTVKVNERAHGFTFDAVVRAAATGPGGAAIQVFQVQSEQATTLTCQKWVNNAADGTNVTVQKPLELQISAQTYSQYGLKFLVNPFTFQGTTSVNKRTNQLYSAANPKPYDLYVESIMQGYIYGANNNLIWAVAIPTAMQVDNVAWQDLNVDRRGWKKESIVCTATGQTMLALVDTSCSYPVALTITNGP